jgi:hypothetical protein
MTRPAKPEKSVKPAKAAKPAGVSKPKKSAVPAAHEESPIISFMWLDEGHNEVPVSQAIYGFGIRADGGRFVLAPTPNPAPTENKGED